MKLIHRWRFVLGLVCAQANPLWAFTQEVYVWQRQFSPVVYQALEAVRSDTDGYAVLAAEVSWEKNRPRLFRSNVDYTALAAKGRPVGLVLRIGPYAGRFASDDEPARYLAGVVDSLLNAARTNGLEPAELQIDFDCASSKLAGYRLWLAALKLAAGSTKIVFTALPDWLGREDFPALARTADGYVLQVHSLEKPAGPEQVFQLCDPDRAWAWIAQAARIGVPFRVALPTYGYRLAFDVTGKFIALSAEGPPVAWPANTQLRSVRADASTVAKLAQRLGEARLEGCTGIIWFRLPVTGDQLNWELSTLKVVLRGAVPVSQLVADVIWSADGLAEVSLVNRGERDELLPSKIGVRWADDGRVIVADGLSGYSPLSDRARAGVMVLSAKPALAEERIAPGRSRKIGWIRFSHEIPLTLQLTAFP